MKKTIMTLVASVILLSGCASTTKGNSDYDPSVNFTRYSTFAWITEHPMIIGSTAGRQINPMTEGRVMRAPELAAFCPLPWLRFASSRYH